MSVNVKPVNILKRPVPTYRHEKKYLMDVSDAEVLRLRLEKLLARDVNTKDEGIYKIRSIYFDDYWDTAYEEKVMGILRRRKYRIRVYNDSDDIIRLECKVKRNSYISKPSAVLTREETERLLNGDCSFLLDNPQPLCVEFYYEYMTNVMRPKVIVDYEREPFVFKEGDVRVTFDMDLRASMLRYDLFDSDLPSLRVLDPGQVIMEVKYTEFLPSFIRELLPQHGGMVQSLSKYIMARDKLMYLSASAGY